MPSGRLENENKEFNKIEEQLKDLPNIFSEYYYAMRAEKKSYRTIQEYLKSIELAVHELQPAKQCFAVILGKMTHLILNSVLQGFDLEKWGNS